MKTARRRVAAWTSGILDLSNLNLTELPPLPAALRKLNCGWNKLTSLPELPATLIELCCTINKLTSLPDLPATLTRLSCGNNELTSLPFLPATLTYLDCNNNKLTSLPDLPATLRYFRCKNNSLLVYPNNDELAHDYEKRLRHAEEQQSRERSVVRCRAVMEELMIVCWAPDRLDRLIASYGLQQWNYDLKKYTPLTWNTINEIL